MIRHFWKILLTFFLIMIFNPYSHANNNIKIQEKFSITLNVKHLDGEAAKELVAYLEPVNPVYPLPINQTIIKISQIEKAFAPYISVMQKGGQVNFINEDDITHHIYSPVSDNKFSFKIKTNEQKLFANFEHTGEVAMGCNIHDWMSGYILVVDTPYYAKTDVQGQVAISEVVAGDYLLNIWHPQLNSTDNRQVQRVEINKNVELLIKLESPLLDLPVQKSEDDFDFLSDY